MRETKQSTMNSIDVLYDNVYFVQWCVLIFLCRSIRQHPRGELVVIVGVVKRR